MECQGLAGHSCQSQAPFTPETQSGGNLVDLLWIMLFALFYLV